MIFTTLFEAINSGLNTFLNERLDGVIEIVEGPLRLAAVLYIVLFGIAILRGAIDEPFMDFALRACKILFITFLVSAAGYNQYVTGPLFNDLPDLIGNSISGSSGTVGATFDSLMAKGFVLANKITQEGGWFEIGPAVYGIVVYVFSALMAGIGFAVATIAKVVLAILVALGPIFIACALFESTRRFFFGWLSQCVNYVLLFGLILAMMELVLSLTNSVYPQISAYSPQLAGMTYVALSLLSLIFFLWAPSIATGISGGASLGIGDFIPRGGFPVGRAGGGGQPPPPPTRGGSIR